MIRSTLGRLLNTGGGASDNRPKNEIAAFHYERAKALVRSPNINERNEIASHPDTPPELLYFLARDRSHDVRLSVANHAATPRQADLLLAVDESTEIRTLIAEKVTRQLKSIPADEASQIWQLTISILEALARDDLVKVRQLVADTAREVERFPDHVALTLAKDKDANVAVSALGYRGQLADDELIEIINEAHDPRIVSAIARRPSLSAKVSRAVVDRGSDDSIEVLLSNKTAEIAPDTLNTVIDRAAPVTSWHQPLAARPDLSEAGARRLAGFVTGTVAKVARVVGVGATKSAPAVPEPEAGLARARRLHTSDSLTEDTIVDALGLDQDFVIAALALRSKEAPEVVQKILNGRSAKGLTALAWKAGYSMRLGLQLQLRQARLPPKARLTSSAGKWPLNQEEMAWQIEFFRELAGRA